MNFLLSEEQIQMQNVLFRLLEDNCDSAALHAVIDGDEQIAHQLWAKLVQYGLAGMIVPERFGGLGLEMIDLALSGEVLGRFAAPTPFLGHTLATIAIMWGGSEAQREEWLPKLASGACVGTVALRDNNGGWLPGDWTLAMDGNAVSGEMWYAPNATQADLVVVGAAGGDLLLVDARHSSVEMTGMIGIDLTRPLHAARFTRTPATRLENAAKAGSRLVDAALVLLAADAFGGATRCVDMAVKYANEREQFGVPLSEFQALRHQLADMALKAEPCRGLYWYAAHAYDHLSAAASEAAALAKVHISEKFLGLARDNIEIHGGVGYTWDFDPHIWLKRAMFDWSWAGPPQLHSRRAADLAGW